MRIGILSDIHGNLPALAAVLDHIKSSQVDALYCLGDLVGYAAFPNEVVERIRTEGIPTIMGNYDDGVGFELDDCGCAYTDPVEKQLGDESLAWTKAAVTTENKAFLRTLAREIRFEADGKWWYPVFALSLFVVVVEAAKVFAMRYVMWMKR